MCIEWRVKFKICVWWWLKYVDTYSFAYLHRCLNSIKLIYRVAGGTFPVPLARASTMVHFLCHPLGSDLCISQVLIVHWVGGKRPFVFGFVARGIIEPLWKAILKNHPGTSRNRHIHTCIVIGFLCRPRRAPNHNIYARRRCKGAGFWT